MPPSTEAQNDVRKYKPFIDGLRAIAILTVVAAHVDLPGLGGGFVGVDIFFVISGYLIINQIIADIDTRRFSLFDFYARRAFRILPAFLLVMVTCLVLATTVFLPPDGKEFAEAFFLSTIMAANHHYMAHQGYFDMSAFTKPYLHMWSLAVEEQFYLLAPLILLGLTAVVSKLTPETCRKTWAAMTLGMAILSFAACVAFTYPSGRANVSFYIMATRGWEFILGGIAPALIPVVRRWPAWIGGWLATAGIIAIGLAVVLFDADTLYPSYRAMPPAFGAMLIIVGGLTDSRNSVARALSTWPMVRIGLISYALYLWHWPLISMVRTMRFGKQDVASEVGAVALSFVLAALTYYFIESPVRRWRRSYLSRPVAAVAVGSGACVVVASIGYLWALRVAPDLLPSITGLEPVAVTTNAYPPVRHRGILLGDSHAWAIQHSIEEYARRAGALVTTNGSAGCPPLLQTAEVTSDRGDYVYNCAPFFREIAFHGYEFAIIAARWNFYLGLPPSDPYFRSAVLVAKQSTNEPASAYEQLAKGLAATISEAKHSGVQRILVVGPWPEFPWHAPYCVMRTIRFGIGDCSIARTTVETRRNRTMETLRRVVAGFEGVRLIDPIDLFCTADQCSPNEGRKLFFSDTNHLSTAGNERLYKAYEHDFLWAFTGAQ